MATEALGVLTHVAALWAGLWRGQQVGKAAFLAAQWGLETEGRGGRVRGHAGAMAPQPCGSPPPARTFSKGLWPLGPGLRPRSPSLEPNGEEPMAWRNRRGEVGWVTPGAREAPGRWPTSSICLLQL